MAAPNYQEIEEALASIDGLAKVSPLWAKVLPELRFLVNHSKGFYNRSDASGAHPDHSTGSVSMPRKVSDRVLALLKDQKEPLKSAQILGLFIQRSWIAKGETEADIRKKIQNQLVYLSTKRGLLEGDGKVGYRAKY